MIVAGYVQSFLWVSGETKDPNFSLPCSLCDRMRQLFQPLGAASLTQCNVISHGRLIGLHSLHLE